MSKCVNYISRHILMRILELFSGTHSIGKVAHKEHEIISLDRDLGATHEDYTSTNHIKKDIMDWDYKEYEEGHFDIITASPVCLWWSNLRSSWIGRKCKTINPDGSIVKKEDIERDIDLYGKPMVDKVFEIIEYFKPKYWWIENPQTGRMKHYIGEKYPQYNTYYDVDYCKYSDWGYKKSTRIWTNIKDFKPKRCKNDCENMVNEKGKKRHSVNLSSPIMKEVDGVIVLINTKETREKYKHIKPMKLVGSGKNKLERYRIPEKLIQDLLNCCN